MTSHKLEFNSLYEEKSVGLVIWDAAKTFGMKQSLELIKSGWGEDIADISIYRVTKKTLKFEENINWASFGLVVDYCLSGFSVREGFK